MAEEELSIDDAKEKEVSLDETCGRITIFSLTSCRHCKKAKALFKKKDWAFYEISLSDYPEKRSDMIKLSDGLTVPQVFFSKHFVGGASELEKLEAEGKLDALYKKEIVEGKTPTETEYQRPDYAPKKPEPPAPLNEKPFSINGKEITFGDLQELLRTKLEIGPNKTGMLSSAKRTFTGKDLVKLLELKFDLKTEEADKTAKMLVEKEMIVHHAEEEKTPELKSDDELWRLQCHRSPLLLNNWRIWNDRVEEPIKLIHGLKKQLDSIKGKHSMEGGLTDYVAVYNDPDFYKFREASCELQGIKMEDMDRNTKVAFLINLYNMMITHAFTQVGIYTNGLLSKGKFFGGVKYNIGGHKLSFEELENGILRGNGVRPYTLFAKETISDENFKKLGIILKKEELEPRIHMSLNCGALSCPPVKKFSPKSLDEELRVVTASYLESKENMVVDTENKILKLNKIFSWYKDDFGADDLSVAKWIVGALRDGTQLKADVEKLVDAGVKGTISNRGGFKIQHLPYDWNTDSGNHEMFCTKQVQDRL